MTKTKPTIAITVDVEDWPQSSWDRSLPLSDYCADNTRRLLGIISEFPSARATFFILGKFAEKHPNVVREIYHAGHEIGSHGWGHVEIFRLGQDKFQEDIKRSTKIIADIIGKHPPGYRAPDFSIVGETLWALEILAKEGYTYDSSIFPISKARYGIYNWPRTQGRVKLKSGLQITELPLATLKLFGKLLPIGGGGYARLMPQVVLVKALRKAESQLGFPPVFYCHPYEIDPKEFDRLKLDIPFKVRLHQGLGRKTTTSKLRQLLRNFECITLSEIIARYGPLHIIDYSHYILEPGSITRPPIF